jgi:hypothetical protein
LQYASAGFLLGLLFYPEHGGDFFPRNVWLPPNCIALQPEDYFLYSVGFEVFKAVTMNNAVFWGVAKTQREQVAAELAISAATVSRWVFARGFLYPEE